MKKLLKTQDILLLGLSRALDLFEEVRDPFSLVSKSYENMYGWVPGQYKRNNFNHLVWRSLKAGYIEKIKKKGDVYIRITSQGANRTQKDFPLLHLQKKSWDGKWRMVMFDIQELEKIKRNLLRRKLKELGFGMLQESVFVTPHDIIKDFSEYIDSIGLRDSVYILEVSHILAGSARELARKIWRLDQLSEKYLEVISEIKKIESSHLTTLNGRTKELNGEMSIGKKTEKKREIKEKYLNILLTDPFLPREMLFPDWAGEEAKKLIKSL